MARQVLTLNQISVKGLERLPRESRVLNLRAIHREWFEGGRVLVCEMVVVDGPAAMPALCLDIEMLVGPGGKERSVEAFRRAFRAKYEVARERCRRSQCQRRGGHQYGGFHFFLPIWL